MRKSPDIPPRYCEGCGRSYKPSGTTQRFCPACSSERKRENKLRHYEKTHPAAQKRRPAAKCCICGDPSAGWIEGSPYCNKHWQRVRKYGTPEKPSRKSTNSFAVEGEVLVITLKNGSQVLSDADCYELLKGHSWCISKTGYAVANISRKTVKMHRFIMGEECEGMIVDHKNGDPLDNRRSNLRVCTAAENARNVKASRSSRTGHLGIRITKDGKFNVRIVADGVEHHVGNFDTLDLAIEAREAAEDKYHKEFASHIGSGSTENKEDCL